MGYSHRLATREDLPAIVDIYNAAILEKASTCDLEPVSVASREGWFESSRLDFRPIWVGYETDDPCTVTGYLSFEPFLNGRPGYNVTSDVALYLHPEHRGRGQGTYLLGEAVTHAPKLGVRTVATTIFGSNRASLSLFRSHGFEEWGRLPAVADLGGGVVQDVVFVGRKVDGSAG
ncbi:phosphinothricin acetyltransferase [Actinopolyspora xinjiangensis]|uniref:Phosphinothricin acetyltransferase n=1 Tax=Actinopolyspora xinjiangensis TaxID=405564 RepID=A0A1H0W751_9ACTN|nr:GNAT family N-acetyltransferase [Actinopolyspora xinjiangensis]SDP86570.1 phosphinothricin acetyltransferase [Actinopolyspora xinjiangensis]